MALSVAAPRARFRAPCDATPWRYQARCPAVAGSCEFATAGVRTFLPPIPLARSGPAITRLTRWNYYTTCSARGIDWRTCPDAILERCEPTATRESLLLGLQRRGENAAYQFNHHSTNSGVAEGLTSTIHRAKSSTVRSCWCGLFIALGSMKGANYFTAYCSATCRSCRFCGRLN